MKPSGQPSAAPSTTPSSVPSSAPSSVPSRAYQLEAKFSLTQEFTSDVDAEALYNSVDFQNMFNQFIATRLQVLQRKVVIQRIYDRYERRRHLRKLPASDSAVYYDVVVAYAVRVEIEDAEETTVEETFTTVFSEITSTSFVTELAAEANNALGGAIVEVVTASVPIYDRASIEIIEAHTPQPSSAPSELEIAAGTVQYAYVAAIGLAAITAAAAIWYLQNKYANSKGSVLPVAHDIVMAAVVPANDEARLRNAVQVPVVLTRANVANINQVDQQKQAIVVVEPDADTDADDDDDNDNLSFGSLSTDNPETEPEKPDAKFTGTSLQDEEQKRTVEKWHVTALDAASSDDSSGDFDLSDDDIPPALATEVAAPVEVQVQGLAAEASEKKAVAAAAAAAMDDAESSDDDSVYYHFIDTDDEEVLPTGGGVELPLASAPAQHVVSPTAKQAKWGEVSDSDDSYADYQDLSD